MAATAETVNGPRNTVLLGGLTETDFILTPINLQSFRLRRRFGLTLPMARVVAFLAFEGGRA